MRDIILEIWALVFYQVFGQGDTGTAGTTAERSAKIRILGILVTVFLYDGSMNITVTAG